MITLSTRDAIAAAARAYDQGEAKASITGITIDDMLDMAKAVAVANRRNALDATGVYPDSCAEWAALSNTAYCEALRLIDTLSDLRVIEARSDRLLNKGADE